MVLKGNVSMLYKIDMLTVSGQLIRKALDDFVEIYFLWFRVSGITDSQPLTICHDVCNYFVLLDLTILSTTKTKQHNYLK